MIDRPVPLSDWPVARTFEGRALTRVRMPVGGIGTGGIGFGGRGQLLGWQLFNRPSLGFTPMSFAALTVQGPGVDCRRVLEGQLTPGELDGSTGSQVPAAGLPRFRAARFEAAYPFGRVTLTDPAVPVEARVGAYHPFVPGDADASGIPLLAYRAELHNTGADPLEVALTFTVPDVTGATQRPDRHWDLAPGNGFRAERLPEADVLVAHRDGLGESDGSIALALLGSASSMRTAWARRSWGDSLLDFWEDLADGALEQPDDLAPVGYGSLTAIRRLAPGETTTVDLLIAWHFPNRGSWAEADGPPTYSDPDVRIGNYYTGRFADALDVIRRTLPQLPTLERQTLEFVRSVTESDLPPVFAEAALSNLAVLTSPVCFRAADGTFLGWEGQHDDVGSCFGSCTHVWNYQYALEDLFPELAWTMREVELVHSLDERGMMSFRAGLPLETHGRAWPVAAADGQMGALVRLYRTHRRQPDPERLRRLWPAARRALAFAWVENGWDADRDGVMEGCQHNTMDVEYFGPSGVNQSWYLAALVCVGRLAAEVGDDVFAQTCQDVADAGCRGTDAMIFNGEFYEQAVMPPGSADRIAPGLRIRYDAPDADEGSDDLQNPNLQIGPGCTADQLAGHSMAWVSGAQVGLSPANVSAAVDAVYRYNRRAALDAHTNHLRTYAAGGEGGVLNGTYPHGGRPARPFPYVDEVWTGVEYTAVVALLLEGRTADAEQVVGDVRNRYDGERRNPFDEVECGHHYVRSMASWGVVEAWRASRSG